MEFRKFMKRCKKTVFNKIMVLTMAMMLAAGSITGCAAVDQTAQAAEAADAESENAEEKTAEEKLTSAMESQVVRRTGTGDDTGKDETVYVISDAAGTARQVIVSEWLKNSEGKDTIEDITNLKDIENVKGNETWTKGADGKITWQADGNDIYYQGTSDQELPVQVKLTYYLDGKEIAPENLAGKSGKVTIRFDYTNTARKTVTVNGKKEEIAVPFAVISGAILSSDHFKNVEVTNGRVISDGENDIVVGLALPGLSDSLKLDELGDKTREKDSKEKAGEDEKLNIPEYVEITADAVDFKLDMTITMALNDALSDLNLTDSLDMSEASDSVDDLTDASAQLVDGSGQLKDGVETLHSGTGELQNGIGSLANGISVYTAGAGQLADGISSLKKGTTQLKGGAGSLSAGMVELESGAGSLADGTGQLKEGAAALTAGTGQLKEKVPELVNGIQALKDGSSSLLAGAGSLMQGYEGENGALQGAESLAGGLNSLKSSVDGMGNVSLSEDQLDGIGSAASGQISSDSAKQLVEACGITPDQESYDALVSAITRQLQNAAASGAKAGAQAAVDGVNEKLSPQIDSLKNGVDSLAAGAGGLSQGLQKLYAGTGQLRDGAQSLDDGLSQLNAQTGTLSEGVAAIDAGAGSLAAGIDQVDSGAGALKDGISQAGSGAKTLAEGAETLDDGASQLKSGSDELTGNSAALNDGAGKLMNGSDQLADGVVELLDGAVKLNDGMVQFDEEGIRKIADLLGDDLDTLTERLEAVINAGKDYQTFTGLSDGVKGSVKFIIRTGAVK